MLDSSPLRRLALPLRALAVLLLTLALAPSAWCSAPQGTGNGFRADVRFVNFAPVRRHEWGLATVPFPPGTWTAGKQFAVRGVPSELRPFGARWPDGSVRYAQLAVLTDLAPNQERLYTVEEVAPNLPAFQLSPWVQSRSSTFDVTIAVGLSGGIVKQVGLRPIAVVADTPARKTIHYRDRIPDTQLVYDLWITFFSGQDNARFELRLTSSMIGDPEWSQPVDWVVLAPRAAIPIVRGRIRQRLIGPAFDPGGLNPVLLLGPTSFFDGQANEWFGDLLFFDKDVSVPDPQRRIDTMVAVLLDAFWGVAENWPESGAWGPFGYLPDPPPWITDGGRAAAIQSRTDFLQWYYVNGEMWEDRPLALREYPAVTGTQHDFGVGKFVDVFVSAMPHRIEEVRYTAGEEAYRPVHHREPDGSMLRAVNHPNWVARSGRTHWSSSVSQDRLGKPPNQPNLREVAHGWFGKDHEHWSSLVLSSAYLLTGSHSLHMELDNDAELFLASHLVESIAPGSPANSINNGRALGRVMLTMAWNYLLTDRADVAQRMQQRVDESVVQQHYGLIHGGVVLPLHVIPPDPRIIASGDQWVPWQEAQAVLGLEATARVTGSTTAHLMGYLIARNLILHGWRVDFENSMVAYAVRYLPGGAAIPPHLMTSPEYYAWPSSPRSFNVWSLPSTCLALQYARQYNDTELLGRAQTIEYYTRLLREWPRTGAQWDPFTDWDCIR